MKYLFFIILVLNNIHSLCQSVISGQIKGIHKAQTILINVPFDCWYYSQFSKPVVTDEKGYFSSAIRVERPQLIFIEYSGKRMLLYTEPNKTISFDFDSSGLQQTLEFKGDLKKENEFRKNIGLTFFNLTPQTWNDSLSSPAQITSSIKINQQAALKALKALKGKTSVDFKIITKADIEYFLPVKIWNIIYSEREPLKDHKQEWQEILRDAYQQKPLSNDNAVNSYYYQNMIAYYARYLNATSPDKKAFEKLTEQIFKKPFAEIYKEIVTKGKRYWEYKAINDVLKNHALDHAIASFIDNGINIGELNYLQEAYSDYLFRFPKSIYRSHIDGIMKPYISSQSSGSIQDQIFEIADSSYAGFKDILKKHKGRVVYIDLWGSWCGPCREEFMYNQPLKVYFAGKPVDFIYIAFEHGRENPEDIWKKTVKYYQLTGRHILAGQVLKNDIDTLYAPHGLVYFPGYMLIDKDGAVRNLYAERPSSKDLLYKQIEQLLK